MPDHDEVLEAIRENTARALAYSRWRFLGTWLAVSLLAILTAVALVAISRNTQTDVDQNEEIAMLAGDTADAAKAQSEDTVAYLRGEQGIPGVPGANGVDGTPGQPSSQPGPRGVPGTDGQPGATGPAGPFGPIGPQGAQGPAGTSTTTPTGEAGPQGEPGPQGERGEKGDAGAAGATGPAGPAGPAGTSSVTTSIALAASANDTAAHKQVTATCTAGRASGGGFATVPSDPGIDVSASSPVGNTGWNATADVLSLPAGTTWQLLAFAVCVT